MNECCLILGKSEVHLVTNRVSKSNIGTCFVRFSVPEEAMKAFEELDGTDFQVRYHTLNYFDPVAQRGRYFGLGHVTSPSKYK